MNKEQIIALAYDNGAWHAMSGLIMTEQQLLAFAEAIQDKQREENAKICEDQARRIEELEAEIKQLAAWSEDCTTKLERRQAHLRAELFALASTVSEYLLFTAKSTDLSRAYHSAIEVINSTPAQSEAQKWNQLRRCHKYFGG